MGFTKKEVVNFIAEHKRVFDIVCIVDVSMTKQYQINADGEFIS